MKNFIEVTLDKERMIMNINHIVIVQPYDTGSSYDVSDKCVIGLSLQQAGGKDSFYTVSETYDQIKELIEQASK